MIYTILAPLNVRTHIQLPASKSISNRVLILNALSKSVYPVENLSCCNDTQVMLKALEQNYSQIDIGASGTSMRFLTAYLSQLPGEYTITGTERMQNRPIGILKEALCQLGAEIDYLGKAGYPPLKIKGKSLTGGEIHLKGNVSSQYISALMMIAPHMKKGLVIRLEGSIISRPYLAMTARLMENFGIKVDWQGSVIRIENQSYQAKPFKVEADWSAASYWYEIASLCKENTSIKLFGLEPDSIQGDSGVSRLFAKLGINTGFISDCNELNPPLLADTAVLLKKMQLGSEMTSNVKLNWDFIDIPDLAQTVVVTCCLLNIPFRFTGLESLRIKETDRIAALRQELKKLGYIIRTESHGIIEWAGEKISPERDPVIFTYEDHRMAMAFAPVCLLTQAIKIKNPEVVSKSYPNFWHDLERAGFLIREN
ncbi:MAG: 3-phosphoshikimate 1-carboxyvinyltransferase [Dysgonamonadaceae bacterium]|jgi:3-phosphoshikimate 1-carboxyvinyltransferase|nr:3-phosphoshikimate 1-carboxyvinyltransferase [Dysgonamonadaceae bacterium]